MQQVVNLRGNPVEEIGSFRSSSMPLAEKFRGHKMNFYKGPRWATIPSFTGKNLTLSSGPARQRLENRWLATRGQHHVTLLPGTEMLCAFRGGGRSPR